MSLDDDDYKKKHGLLNDNQEGEEDSGQTGSDTGSESGTAGGSTGQIEFRDFLAEGARDDLLPPAEKRRLLELHKNISEANIKKQKAKREYYKDLKKANKNALARRQGMGADNPYKLNPILADKPQFSGITDNGVNPVPAENKDSEANNGKREELQYQYSLRYNPELAPKFNPKPSPYR